MFETILIQMLILFLFIAIGYVFAKAKVVPNNSENVLSKLVTFLFNPALILTTFIKNCTIEKLSQSWKFLLVSTCILVVVIPLSFFIAKRCSKEKFVQNIYVYGLCFSNFGFMGNAIVSAVFPHIFMEYSLFCIVLWVLIYVWAVPVLLMGQDFGKSPIKEKIKCFTNPMIIAVLIGVLIGLTGLQLPNFAINITDKLGDCMSPVAMLLTGMTIARRSIKEVLKPKSIYVVSAFRLIIFPMIFIIVAMLVPMNITIVKCAFLSLAMPLGLNTIVIPSAYGQDTKVASGMALVSHVLACITIPIMYKILELLVLT